MGEAVVKEPSMEEILSSIRKIITDDSNDILDQPEPANIGAREPAPSAMSSAPAPQESIAPRQPVSRSPDVQDVPQSIPAPVAARPEAIVPPQEIYVPPAPSPEVVVELVEEKAEAVAPVFEAPRPAPAPVSSTPVAPVARENTPAPQAEVVSAPAPTAEATSRDEADTFKGALMSPGTDEIVSEAFERLKRETMESIEDKTESILRPMLSEWLDNNLPTLVERLVREEIERVSRGR